MTKKITVTAKTLDAAISQAATELGVNSSKIEHKLISQTNGGILSFLGGGKKIEIEAWSTESTHKKSSRGNGNRRRNEKSQKPRRESSPRREASKSEPALDLPELTEDEKKALVEELRMFAADLFEHIAGEAVETTATLEGDQLMINGSNDYLEEQMSQHRKLGESIEHILRKKPRHLKRRPPFRVFVDVGNSRKKREFELTELAKEMSQKVLDEKKPVVLNYRSAYDRKVIHMALDKDEKVFTKSIGSGTNRKLMIVPADSQETTV